jgi:hypothetical protein
MEERRRVRRTVIRRDVTISSRRRHFLVNCTATNITTLGACLSLAGNPSVPDQFDVSLDGGRSYRACRVAWRQGDRVGVEFE